MYAETTKVREILVNFLKEDEEVKEEIEKLDWGMEELAIDIRDIINDGVNKEITKDKVTDVLHDLLEAGR